jgi:hypothetical protein
MAAVTRIPRRRGSLCGALLILLGAWGALVPFVGPYFRFAFTPDRTWDYTTGRLYLSILPGAAAVAGGLLVAATRSRAAGTLGGLLAAAGGAWFVAGQGIVTTLLKRPSITAGVPVPRGAAAAAGPTTAWQFLEMLGFFTGVGILIIFFGALGLGRFTMISARDVVAEPAGYGDDYADPADAATSSYPAGATFPGDEPSTAQFPSPTGQFPASRAPFEPGPAPESSTAAAGPE